MWPLEPFAFRCDMLLPASAGKPFDTRDALQDDRSLASVANAEEISVATDGIAEDFFGTMSGLELDERDGDARRFPQCRHEFAQVAGGEF